MKTVFLFSCGLMFGMAAMAAEPWPFFALCMDTHDSQHRSLPEQAALLKELGYDGAAHVGLDNLPERLDSLEAVGLRLFQVYVYVSIAPDKEPYDPRLVDILPRLKSHKTSIALLISGLPASDPAGDARAVPIIQSIAELAAAQELTVALYPHVGDWVERVEDGLRLLPQVNRPNVGVMFNLCHWLKVDKEENLAPLIASAGAHLSAVTICGADHNADVQGGKGNWIQPLGRGSFDVPGLMKRLREAGFTGPVGLQCYGIEGDVRDALTESMRAWRAINATLEQQP